MKNILIATICMFLMQTAFTQDFDKSPSLGISSGLMNYQGDLQPNSFTLLQSNPFISFWVKKPLTRHVVLRSGFLLGTLQGDDKFNRDYLQQRNLSFNTSVKEIYTGFEVYAFPFDKNRASPYLFAGVAAFRFNPYTYTGSGDKVYLQPLSTEGQGIADYPERKPYSLTQATLTGGLGVKYAMGEMVVGIEFNQRKTFTDYLDDVSSSYVDKQKLLAAKGQLAVDLAFRGDELNNANLYPSHGEQRGTPTEKDWYYSVGISAEIRLHTIKQSVLELFKGEHDWYYKKCPRVY